MARKRPVFFRYLQRLVKHFGLSRRWNRGPSRLMGGEWRSPRLLQRFIVLVCLSLLMVLSGLRPGVTQTVVDSFPAAVQQVELGQRHYEQGNLSSAEAALKQAAGFFKAQEQTQQQAITLGNLSLVYQAQGNWKDADRVLQESFALLGVDVDALSTDQAPRLPTTDLRILAPTLDIYGRLWQIKGQPERALKAWQQAAVIYQQQQNQTAWLSNQLNQTLALESLGLHGQAQSQIEMLRGVLQQSPDSTLKLIGLRRLGDVLRTVGELGKSKTALQDSLAVAQQLKTSSDQADVALSLGNTFLALGDREIERAASTTKQNAIPWECRSSDIAAENLDWNSQDQVKTYYQQAQTYYNQANASTAQPETQLTAQLNGLKLLTQQKHLSKNKFEIQAAVNQWNDAEKHLKQLPLSRAKVYADINLAQQGACLKQQSQDIEIGWNNIEQLLKLSVSEAQSLEDPRAISYALGNLGGLYELFSQDNFTKSVSKDKASWYRQAQALTTQALLQAQPLTAPDLAYQWQWQLGRLEKNQGHRDQAIALYQQAVKTLEAVRSNLLSIDSEVQFSFRDGVEPVYRELAALLLEGEKPEQPKLKQAIGLIDTLQLAELENFMRCDLSGTIELSKNKLEDQTSAIIYTVILEDSLEVIIQLPNQEELSHHRILKPRSEIVTTLDRLREELEKPYLSSELEVDATEVYGWLLGGEEAALQLGQIKNLVFVLDGALRNVPVAALRDRGGRYLIENYAIALTSRLQLQQKSTALGNRAVEALFFGLAEMPELFQSEFNDLPFVKAEGEQISALVPTRVVLNSNFTNEVLQREIQTAPFSVVHFATHGEFSSDPDSTFVLAWDKKVTSNELRNTLQRRTRAESIDLLVLSACETADGDNRATLGLAGLALQAGAESTLASLWVIDDPATSQLTEAFYRALFDAEEPISRAEALRQAQLELLRSTKYLEPAFWAPYVLVGNWL